MNETIENILQRRSVRTYKPNQITEDELSVIINTAKYAPYSYSDKYRHFTVIQEKQLLNWMSNTVRQIISNSGDQRLVSLVEQNDFDVFHNAPTVIIISGNIQYEYSYCDCALSMQNMAIAAQSLNISTCVVTGFKFMFSSIYANMYMHKLGIPEGFTPLYALVLGYDSKDSPKIVTRSDDCINYIR